MIGRHHRDHPVAVGRRHDPDRGGDAAHRAGDARQNAAGRVLALARADHVEPVDRKREDRHHLALIVLGRRRQIGLAHLADKQPGRIIDPHRGVLLAPDREEL